MKKYVCTICGYVFDEEKEGKLWEDLPEDWLCPLCGASKSEFELQGQATANNVTKVDYVMDEDLRELKPHEMATICSNLAKGCGKQYLDLEAKAFLQLEEYFNKKSLARSEAIISDFIKNINDEISGEYKEANAIIDETEDRGSKRALVWSEKVTRMLKSVLDRYEVEGDSYLENTKIYVCEICGFIYIGDDLPKVCPVCKVPNFKLREVGRD
ncbi:rubredoxin-like domain-containing protein [Clostridium sp. DL1XJH146]